MEENKRKAIILTFIGALTLLFVVVGGTFAYFQIVNTSEGSTSTDFNAQTDNLNKYGTPLLTKKSDLYIELSASDMAYSKANTKYYATLKAEPQEKNYETEKQNHVISTASIERPEGDNVVEDAYLKCTSELTITITGTMKDELQTGDGTLYLGTKSSDGNSGSVTPASFDLADLVSKEVTKENKATVNYTITGFTSVDVTADIEIVNREEIQNVLAGTKIEITITNNNLSCSVSEKPSTVELLKENAGESLTTELVGDMHRYQGTNNVPNWICFGTRDQEQCKTDYDKYMYRIIGVTEEGQMYLLKETFLKEGSVTSFAWNHDYLISGNATYLCPDGNCPEWNNADLFKRINGISNGATAGADTSSSTKSDTDIFVDNEYYDYLKSGDENGGTEDSEWYNLINNHDWYYGDTTTSSYDGNTLYNIETGKSETNHYAKGEDGSVTSQSYTWTNKVNAKISLMYLHDYAYAYPNGTPGSYTNVANSWIHFRKDGYNTDQYFEWLSTRYGIHSTSRTDVVARRVDNGGDLGFGTGLNSGYGARPVFYLSSKAKITGGDGSQSLPYILG